VLSSQGQQHLTARLLAVGGGLVALFLFCAIPLAYLAHCIYNLCRQSDQEGQDDTSDSDNLPSAAPPTPLPSRASVTELVEGPPILESQSGHIMVTSTMNPRAARQANGGPVSMLSLTHLGDTGYAHTQPAALCQALRKKKEDKKKEESVGL